MSALAVCDGCGWTTPVENTGDFGVPQGRVNHHLIPTQAKGCGCPRCYKGRWSHTCTVEDMPPLYVYVVVPVSPARWYDWCPLCMAPPSHVKGPPTSWKVARGAFVLASVVTTFWLWMRLWMLALTLAHG